MYSMSKSPAFRGILYIEDELHTELPEISQVTVIGLENSNGTKTVELLTEAVKAQLSAHGLCPQNCLMLAATDAAIRAAKNLQMAVAAYVNPEILGQTYYGAEMLIEGFEEVDEEFLFRIFQRHHDIPWTIAKTKRCLIRELAMEDVEDLVSLYEQPGITYLIDSDGERRPGYIEPLYPLEEERVYQENYRKHMYRYYGYGMWLVLDQKSGQLIGRAGIEHREYPEGIETELGYLIHPGWQRKGIATEVCSAIIDYARRYLECAKLNLLTEAQNIASVALAEKLGFSYVGDTEVSGSLTRRYVLQLSEK